MRNTGLGALVTRLPTGAAPQGVCADPTTGRTFVHDFLGRTVTVLQTQALYAEGSLQVPSVAVSMVASEPLTTPVLQGKRIFYHAGDPRMSAEGYLSCATCHLDGRDDGRVWDFTGRGEGLRNTTCAGRPRRHGPRARSTGPPTSTRSRTSRTTSAAPSAAPAS
jgi:cytochrome c peroxidase